MDTPYGENAREGGLAGWKMDLRYGQVSDEARGLRPYHFCHGNNARKRWVGRYNRLTDYSKSVL